MSATIPHSREALQIAGRIREAQRGTSVTTAAGKVLTGHDAERYHWGAARTPDAEDAVCEALDWLDAEFGPAEEG